MSPFQFTVNWVLSSNFMNLLPHNWIFVNKDCIDSLIAVNSLSTTIPLFPFWHSDKLGSASHPISFKSPHRCHEPIICLFWHFDRIRVSKPSNCLSSSQGCHKEAMRQSYSLLLSFTVPEKQDTSHCQFRFGRRNHLSPCLKLSNKLTIKSYFIPSLPQVVQQCWKASREAAEITDSLVNWFHLLQGELRTSKERGN